KQLNAVALPESKKRRFAKTKRRLCRRYCEQLGYVFFYCFLSNHRAMRRSRARIARLVAFIMFLPASESHFDGVADFLMPQEIAGDHGEMPVMKHICTLENWQADF